MKIRFPLSAKILLWFFLNLIFLGLVFYVFVRIQFRLGLDSLLMGRAGDRIEAVAQVIDFELNRTPRTEWDDLLQRSSSAYHVQFALFRGDGAQLAGEALLLPAEVSARLTQTQGPPRRPVSPDRPPPEPGSRPERDVGP